MIVSLFLFLCHGLRAGSDIKTTQKKNALVKIQYAYYNDDDDELPGYGVYHN